MIQNNELEARFSGVIAMHSTDVIDRLNSLLADATVLWYKFHNYHWNVRGPSFFTLHDQYERLYTAWGERLDSLAERVLSLGGRPVGTLWQVLDRSDVAEESGTPGAEAMVRQTVLDLRDLRERTKAVIGVAQEAGDRTTENLLDGMIDAIAEDVWMFSAFLGEAAEES